MWWVMMTKISYYSLLLQQSTITQRDFATAMAIFFNSLFFTYSSALNFSRQIKELIISLQI